MEENAEPKRSTFIGLLGAIFENVVMSIRPVELCSGIGCYVWTPRRNNGVPYCKYCEEEGNKIYTSNRVIGGKAN